MQIFELSSKQTLKKDAKIFPSLLLKSDSAAAPSFAYILHTLHLILFSNFMRHDSREFWKGVPKRGTLRRFWMKTSCWKKLLNQSPWSNLSQICTTFISCPYHEKTNFDQFQLNTNDLLPIVGLYCWCSARTASCGISVRYIPSLEALKIILITSHTHRQTFWNSNVRLDQGSSSSVSQLSISGIIPGSHFAKLDLFGEHLIHFKNTIWLQDTYEIPKKPENLANKSRLDTWNHKDCQETNARADSLLSEYFVNQNRWGVLILPNIAL